MADRPDDLERPAARAPQAPPVTPETLFPGPRGDQAAQLDPAQEKELWQGRASWKSLVPGLTLGLGLTIIVALVFLKFGPAWLAKWAWIVGGVLVAAALLRHVWMIISVSYRITTQRIFVRRGILTVTMDQTELLRVDDVKTRQTILERALGLGRVEVFSSDRSDARLTLADIDQPEIVAEHVRRNTRMAQRRTLFMEQL
ncbi:MAG: PH domain-containing protein [Phycisphaerae bacterium]